MTIEQVLQEFKVFCYEVFDKFPLPNTNGTIDGTINRLNEISKDKLESINDLITNKANELASKIDNIDTNVFKNEIKEIARNALADWIRNQ